MSKKKTIEPELARFIKERYQDTSVVIFKEQQRAAARYVSKSAWQADDQDEEGPQSSYRYSRYGNEAILVHKEGNVVTKKDTQAVQSVLCIVM